MTTIGNVASYSLGCGLMWVVLAVVHESAHACTAVLLRLPVIYVRLGSGRLLARFDLRRTVVEIRWSLTSGSVLVRPAPDEGWLRTRMAVMCVSGPAVNLIAGIAGIWLLAVGDAGSGPTRVLVSGTAVSGTMLGLLSLLPIRLGSRVMDGRQLLRWTLRRDAVARFRDLHRVRELAEHAKHAEITDLCELRALADHSSPQARAVAAVVLAIVSGRSGRIEEDRHRLESVLAADIAEPRMRTHIERVLRLSTPARR